MVYRYHMNEGIQTALHWEVEKPRHVWLFDYIAQVRVILRVILRPMSYTKSYTMSYTKAYELY